MQDRSKVAESFTGIKAKFLLLKPNFGVYTSCILYERHHYYNFGCQIKAAVAIYNLTPL